MILQEDRIAAAACFLPLTVNPRVSRELGTRHRAAIGLTEENDAVAIVVSEERGQIALAMNGRIDRGLSPDQLRERLRTFVVQRRGSGRSTSRVRRLMAYHPFRHLGLKVVALALAALLWLTVAGEHVVERSMRVPLEFRNIPASWRSSAILPANVDVRLRGSSALLSRLEAGEVVAVVDLANARPGSRIFHIRNEEVRAPYGVEVTQVVPGTLGIELEKSASRVVPVVAHIDGEPAAGFSVGQHTAEPSTVEVVGPESRVKKLASATTEPVDVAGARQNVSDVVAVGLLDSAVRLVEPQNVTVIVDVLPAPVERELRDVPVQARNLGHGLRAAEIAPAAVAVLIRGRRDALARGPRRRHRRVRRPCRVSARAATVCASSSIRPQHFGVIEFSPAEVAVTLRTSK